MKRIVWKRLAAALLLLAVWIMPTAWAGPGYIDAVPVRTGPAPLLIEGAAGDDLDVLRAALDQPVMYRLGEWQYTRGQYAGYPVVLCCSSAGVGNSAAATVLGIEAFQPVAVISQGTAQGMDAALQPLSIVLGAKSYNGNAWRSQPLDRGAGIDLKAVRMEGTFSYQAAQDRFVQQLYHEGAAGLLAAAHTAAASYTDGPVVDGVIQSGDGRLEQPEQIKYLHAAYGASCEDGETDTVAQMCQVYGVPHLGIRIVAGSVLTEAAPAARASQGGQAYVLQVVRAYIAQQTQAAAAPGPVSTLRTQTYAHDRHPLLLAASEQSELAYTVSQLEHPQTYTLGRWHYTAGTWQGQPMVIAHTAPGIGNTAAAIALAVDFFRPAAILHQGTAGSHDPALAVGTIVLGERSTNSSIWRSAEPGQADAARIAALAQPGVFVYVPEQDAFAAKTYHPADAGLLAAADAARADFPGQAVAHGTLSSSDEWNEQADRILFLHDTFGTSSEDRATDGAAQTAICYGLPWLGIDILTSSAVEDTDQEPMSASLTERCQEYVLATIRHYRQH